MRGNKFFRVLAIGVLATAMLFTVAKSAEALDQPVLDGCYVDWNEDGMLTYSDFLQFVPEFAGFYFEWYVMKTWPQLYDATFPNGKPGMLDWNGDGVLTYDGDVEGYHSDGFTEGFYLTYATIWVQPTPIYQMYMDFIPEQNCIAVSTEVECNYHADCAADEFCDGDGCSTEMGSCDPYLPLGICTKKRDMSECITAPIAPICGCNAKLYLSECQMEAEGDRFKNVGICAPESCSALGADEECPCDHKCVTAALGTFQCLPI